MKVPFGRRIGQRKLTLALAVTVLALGGVACGAEQRPDQVAGNPTERSESGLFERYVGGEGMTEVSDLPFDEAPTDAQLSGAQDLRARAKEYAQNADLTSLEALGQAGYEPISEGNSHWVNLDHVTDGKVLEPERPEFLIVVPGDNNAPEVQGVMFTPGKIGVAGPQPFGNAFIWHYHTYTHERCFQLGEVMRLDWPIEECNQPGGDDVVSRVTPQMLHMWFVPNPQGDFASEMVVPDHDH